MSFPQKIRHLRRLAIGWRWRGGSMMAAAPIGSSPQRRWRRKRRSGWAAVPPTIVRENLDSTGHETERLQLAEGKAAGAS